MAMMLLFCLFAPTNPCHVISHLMFTRDSFTPHTPDAQTRAHVLLVSLAPATSIALTAHTIVCSKGSHSLHFTYPNHNQQQSSPSPSRTIFSKNLSFQVPPNATRAKSWLTILKKTTDPRAKGPLDLTSRKQSRKEASDRLNRVNADIKRAQTIRQAVVALQERERAVPKVNLKSAEIALKALEAPKVINKMSKQIGKLFAEKMAITALLNDPL